MTRLPDDRVWWGLVAMAALAAALLLYATSPSIGVSPDGVIYLDAAARLIREGRLDAFQYGDVKPLAHYPPVLPVVLSLGSAAGLNALAYARWLNVLLLAATVLGSGAVVWWATRSTASALIAAALTAFAADMMGVYATVLSEAPYVPLHIATLFALAVHVSNGSRRALVAAAITAAIACLVRFPAVVLVGTGIVAILLFRRDRIYARIRDAAVFAAASAGPLAIWLLMRASSTGTATNREVAFHPLLLDRLRAALNTFRVWLIPQVPLSAPASLLLVLTATAIFVALCVLVFRRGGPAARIAAVHITFALGYIAFLAVVITLIDAQTSFDPRLMLPVRIALIVPFVIGVHALAASSPRLGRAALVVAAVWMLIGAHRMSAVITGRHENGYGYTSKRWRSLDVPGLVAMADARHIYSNAPEAIYFLAGVQAQQLPTSTNRWSRLDDPDHARDSARMRADLDSMQAAIIYFGNARRPYMASPDELASTLGLSRTDRGEVSILRRTPPLAGVLQADSILSAADVVR